MTTTATGSSRSWAALRLDGLPVRDPVQPSPRGPQTPQPNLARGLQGFLSASANAWARRHCFCGHVFPGRDRTELVEDQSDLGTVSRYVHLNPVRARWVEPPADWRWS